MMRPKPQHKYLLNFKFVSYHISIAYISSLLHLSMVSVCRYFKIIIINNKLLKELIGEIHSLQSGQLSVYTKIMEANMLGNHKMCLMFILINMGK